MPEEEVETEWHACSFEFKFLRAGTELPDYSYTTMLKGLGRAIAYLMYADELTEGGMKNVGILVRELRLDPIQFISDSDIQKLIEGMREADEGD